MSDAKLFNGWVKELTETTIEIQLETEAKLTPHERFAFEIYGFHQNVIVIAELVTPKLDSLLFRLSSNIRLTAPSESVRLRTDHVAIFCKVLTSEGEFEAEVVDVSGSGVGILSPKALVRGDIHSFKFETQYGLADGVGEVRYCKKNADEKMYRIGIKLQFESRVSRGRWAQLFPNAA
jgi:hypothetical protein